MRARGLLLVTLGVLFALVGLDVASADPTFVGRGIQRVLINGTRQPSGVSEIQCVGSSSACYRDGGVVTFDMSAAGGGGSGNIAAPDGGVAARSIMVAGNDGGTQLASTAVAIDVSGNITLPSGATIDGRDLTADGLVIDSLPASSLSASFVAPGDAGFVEGVYRGIGATYNGDAGYVVPACRVSLPLRTACQVRVRWFAASVAGVDASSETVNAGSFCRIYTVRLTSTGITPVDAGLPAYVSNCETDNGGLTAGIHLQSDSGVLEPTVQGVAATHIRWMCRVDNIDCVDNP